MISNIENKLIKISRMAWIIAIFFSVLMLIPFFEDNPISKIWAIAFISLYFALTSIVVALMYLVKSNKFNKLISGEKVIAQWKLSEVDKSKYVEYQYAERKKKNLLNFKIISTFMVVIFGFFIIMMEADSRIGMFYFLVGFLAILAFVAFFTPGFFKNKNLKGDGWVIIGEKYAYINGFFHNWDFPFSGIENVEIIHKPFYGLRLVYYYFVKSTIRNTEEIVIPAPGNMNLNNLKDTLLASE